MNCFPLYIKRAALCTTTLLSKVLNNPGSGCWRTMVNNGTCSPRLVDNCSIWFIMLNLYAWTRVTSSWLIMLHSGWHATYKTMCMFLQMDIDTGCMSTPVAAFLGNSPAGGDCLPNSDRNNNTDNSNHTTTISNNKQQTTNKNHQQRPAKSVYLPWPKWLSLIHPWGLELEDSENGEPLPPLKRGISTARAKLRPIEVSVQIVKFRNCGINLSIYMQNCERYIYIYIYTYLLKNTMKYKIKIINNIHTLRQLQYLSII